MLRSLHAVLLGALLVGCGSSVDDPGAASGADGSSSAGEGGATSSSSASSGGAGGGVFSSSASGTGGMPFVDPCKGEAAWLDLHGGVEKHLTFGPGAYGASQPSSVAVGYFVNGGAQEAPVPATGLQIHAQETEDGSLAHVSLSFQTDDSASVTYTGDGVDATGTTSMAAITLLPPVGAIIEGSFDATLMVPESTLSIGGVIHVCHGEDVNAP